LNSPPSPPLAPCWQLGCTLHTSAPVPPPMTTSLPHASWKFPDELNLSTRWLRVSATYTFPAASVATPIGENKSPPQPPFVPAWQLDAIVQIFNTPAPTFFPHARSHVPEAARADAANEITARSAAHPTMQPASTPLPRLTHTPMAPS